MTTLTDGPCTLAAKRDLLRSLARTWNEHGPSVQALALHSNTHPSLSLPQSMPCHCGACLLCVWDSYMGHLALHDGINGVPGATEVHWSDINDQLTGPDRTGQARTEIAERMADDEDVLLYGTARRTGNGE